MLLASTLVRLTLISGLGHSAAVDILIKLEPHVAGLIGMST